MTTNFEHKSLLAKLLAQENVNVVHSKISTAYFDLETRTIHLPRWNDVSSELIDMLEGHEVGHAMFTPKDGWHNAVEHGGALKSYLNVLEDVRIERKIKTMYPGLRYSFNVAYKQLHDRDFFGLSNYKISELNFIDRVNIFYKLGGHVRVPFSAEETLILNRINKMETWEDVEALGRELYTKELERQAKEKEEKTDDFEENDDRDFENSSQKELPDFTDEEKDFNENEDSFDESDDFNFDDDTNSEDDSESESENANFEENEPKNNTDPEDANVDSLTDRNFRKMEELLVDNAEKYVNAFVPKFDDNIFVSWETVHNNMNNFLENFKNESSIFVVSDEFIKTNREDYFKEFVQRSADSVNYMVKEFEMRKNASQLSRTKTSKSGEIDPNKLARYSITSDIFNRVSSIKQGKSHGLVIFIDLSGSMENKILQTFEQAIALTMFCNKVNIPYDVYGFTDNPSNILLKKEKTSVNFEPKENYLNLNEDPLTIKQYLSSKMNKVQYNNACMNMLYIASVYNKSNSTIYGHSIIKQCIPEHERLNGTPLDSTIIASIEVVNKFKSHYNLDLVNCVFLTDGESVMSNNVYQTVNGSLASKSYSIWYNNKIAFYVQYPNSNIRIKYQNFTSGFADTSMSTRALVELARKATGCKYTGYYISDRKNILHKLRMYQTSQSNQFDKMIRSKLTEEKYHSSTQFGFDEYFMVVDNSIKIEETKMVAPAKPTKNALYKVFSNSIRTQNTQRLFLSKFMQNIAT